MGPAGVNRAQGPGRRLVLTLQFALHYEAVRVIGEGTGLEANDVLTLCGPHDVDGVGRDHTLLEYHVGVAGPICVGQEDLIPLLQLVEVPEHEVALRPRITEPVAREIDVGHIVPRKACAPHVDDAIAEGLVVPALGGVVDWHFVYPIHRRDGELEPLALWSLGTGTPQGSLYRLHDPLRDTPVELLFELFGDPAVYPVGALGRGRRTSSEQGIPQEAEPGEREHGYHKRGQPPPHVLGTQLLHRPRPPFSIRYYGR